MALTSCLDCGRQVSVRAETCPNCGAPLANASTALGTHVVIERTGRRWKKMRLQGAVLLGVGVAIGATPLAPLGVLMFLVGIWFLGRSLVGTWWTNS